jgi:hypothetical protein
MPLNPFGSDDAADPIPFLQNDSFNAQLAQAICARDSRDTRPDDDDIGLAHAIDS